MEKKVFPKTLQERSERGLSGAWMAYFVEPHNRVWKCGQRGTRPTLQVGQRRAWCKLTLLH